MESLVLNICCNKNKLVGVNKVIINWWFIFVYFIGWCLRVWRFFYFVSILNMIKKKEEERNDLIWLLDSIFF